ncbi:MAG: ABC transporter substrate-binding protein [Frankia sp.]
MAAVGAAVVVVAAACGSSSSGGVSKAGKTGTQNYTVGILTDLTGPGASSSKTAPKGFEAGVGLAAQKGYTIKYVVADTGSSPAGALTAAQKLVTRNHVFAVMALSGLTFAASAYLTAHHIPVVGAAIDSTEWITSSNMFSVTGTQDFNKVISTYGLVFKKIGVTNLGTIGYGAVPGSSSAAKGAAISAKSAGVKVGYLNPQFPLFSTDVGPIALAMKDARVDGLITSVQTNVAFGLITALRQQGVNLKGALLPTGYGGDLTQGGPGAVQSAQGVYFLSALEPVEMHTAATERFTKALSTFAGVTSQPTFAEYLAYASIDAFVTGLKAAGSHPSQSSFINAMLKIKNYNADGLYGSHSIGFSMSQRGQSAGADNCFWLTRFAGSSFHLVAGADPICGTVLPGKTVSGS